MKPSQNPSRIEPPPFADRARSAPRSEICARLRVLVRRAPSQNVDHTLSMG